MSAVVLFVLFFVILLFGLPISVTMGISSILPWVVDNTFAANLVMVLRQMMSGVNSLTLLAIPMFMLSGTIMARGGISKKLFDVFTYFVGNVIGGVPCAVIITCLFYGAISGSAPATVAAVGAMTIPVMVNLGYSKEFSTAVVTVAGGLGCIIPPSIPFVLYSTSAGTSVGDMFIAGIVPGLLLGGLLMIYAVYYSARRGEDRVRIKAVMGELRGQGFLRLFLDSFWALITPVIILCGFVVGWFTPTEASSIAVIYSLLIALFLYRTLDWKSFKKCLKDSAISSANTLFIIGTSTLFTYVMAMEGISRQFADVILGISSNPNVVLLVINVLLLVLGMVMEPGAILTLMLPVLLPIANGLGLDLVHFGVMVVLNLMIGQVTPPFGVCLFVISDVNKLKLERLYRSILPFLVPLILTLILVTYIPGIVTALPNALLS